jgi:thiamine biosynthesis lipoprotein
MINLVKPLNMRFKIKTQRMLGFFVLFFFVGCQETPRSLRLSGHTMGTTYHITVVVDNGPLPDEKALKRGIDSVLIEVNRQMSTYIEDSEISRFNRWLSTEPFHVSPEFAQVVRRALYWSKKSKGAFDITISPLVNRWGFGSEQSTVAPPDEELVDSLLGLIGYEKLIATDSTLVKRVPSLQIDLGAIAKGFGVDQVFTYLQDQGLKRVLVEIGGEIRGSGKNERNEIWRVGIETPALDGNMNRRYLIKAHLDELAMATSGDYRNYRVVDGRRISHEIDPRTGYPVQNRVASVTVTAPTCMDADALSTAVMILGAEIGLQFIDSLTGVEAFFILREEDGTYEEIFSAGFRRLE